MSKDSPKKQIKRFVRGLVSSDAVVKSDTTLFSNRLVNSRNLMQLVNFVEQTFQIRVDPLDLILENFDTVDRIAKYVERKRGD